jgi:hypothetical protein
MLGSIWINEKGHGRCPKASSDSQDPSLSCPKVSQSDTKNRITERKNRAIFSATLLLLVATFAASEHENAHFSHFTLW